MSTRRREDKMYKKLKTPRSKRMPLWAKKAETALDKHVMTKKELAEKIGENYSQMCAVMSGSAISERIEEKVCTFFSIER